MAIGLPGRVVGSATYPDIFDEDVMRSCQVRTCVVGAAFLLFAWGCSGEQGDSCPGNEERNPITGECIPVGEPADGGAGEDGFATGGGATGGSTGTGGGTSTGGTGDVGEDATSGDVGFDGDAAACDKDDDGARAESCGGSDCDDTNARIRPGIGELCDKLDNDCDGQVNEDVDCSFYAHEQSDLYRVDPFEESISEVAATNAPTSNFLDMDTHPDGSLWTVTRSAVYRLPEDGEQWSQVSSLTAFQTSVNGMAIDRTGTAFLTGASTLYKLDLEQAQSGAQPTPVGSFQDYSSSGDCVIGKKGTLLMTSVPPGGGEGSDVLVQLDSGDATATELGATDHTDIWGLTAAWSKLYGVTASGELIEIDTTSGSSEVVTTFSEKSFYGAASTPASRRQK